MVILWKSSEKNWIEKIYSDWWLLFFFVFTENKLARKKNLLLLFSKIQISVLNFLIFGYYNYFFVVVVEMIKEGRKNTQRKRGRKKTTIICEKNLRKISRILNQTNNVNEIYIQKKIIQTEKEMDMSSKSGNRICSFFLLFVFYSVTMPTMMMMMVTTTTTTIIQFLISIQKTKSTNKIRLFWRLFFECKKK